MHCHLQVHRAFTCCELFTENIAGLTVCFVQDPRFSQNLIQTLQLAAEQGVKRFGCNGTCEQDWPKVKVSKTTVIQSNYNLKRSNTLFPVLQVAALAKSYSSITPNFGLHPWYIRCC